MRKLILSGAMALAALSRSARPPSRPTTLAAAAAPLAFRRAVRHLRSRRRPARLPDLQGSLLGLPLDVLLAYRNLMELGLTENQVKG